MVVLVELNEPMVALVGLLIANSLLRPACLEFRCGVPRVLSVLLGFVGGFLR